MNGKQTQVQKPQGIKDLVAKGRELQARQAQRNGNPSGKPPGEDGKLLAGRVGSIARSFNAGHAVVKRSHQLSSSPGGTQRSDGLAGISGASATQRRADDSVNRRSTPMSPKPPRKANRPNPGQSEEFDITRTTATGDTIKVGKGIRYYGGQPLGLGRSFTGPGKISNQGEITVGGQPQNSHTVTQRMSFSKKGVHLEVAGSARLGSVSSSTAAAAGERLLVRPICPAVLSDITAEEAKNFSQCIVKKLRFSFVSASDDFKDGAFMQFYARDPTIPTNLVGDDGVDHAATYSDKSMCKISENMEFTVSDPDSQLNYTNESSDPLWDLSGIYQFIVTDAVAAGTYGTVYVDFVVEFIGQGISYAASRGNTGTMLLQWNLDDEGATGSAFQFVSDDQGNPPPASFVNLLFQLDPIPTTTDVRIVAIVRKLNAAGIPVSGDGLLRYMTQSTSTVKTLAVGDAIWFTATVSDLANPWTESGTLMTGCIAASSLGPYDYGPDLIISPGNNHTVGGAAVDGSAELDYYWWPATSSNED